MTESDAEDDTTTTPPDEDTVTIPPEDVPGTVGRHTEPTHDSPSSQPVPSEQVARHIPPLHTSPAAQSAVFVQAKSAVFSPISGHAEPAITVINTSRARTLQA